MAFTLADLTAPIVAAGAGVLKFGSDFESAFAGVKNGSANLETLHVDYIGVTQRK